mmetsp:Transcript_14771/g.24588  ORF Transcript_14771/g.24588 Transcript_14771/m.24588 type:complete len:101 (-) Transcript_14771:363-665(-)
MSDIQTLMDLLRELLSTRAGIVIVLALGMLSGYGLLMLTDAVMGREFSARGGHHIDMKQKIFEEEESNLNTLRGGGDTRRKIKLPPEVATLVHGKSTKSQ